MERWIGGGTLEGAAQLRPITAHVTFFVGAVKFL